jgi:hypothetical protein
MVAAPYFFSHGTLAEAGKTAGVYPIHSGNTFERTPSGVTAWAFTPPYVPGGKTTECENVPSLRTLIESVTTPVK